MPVFSIKMDLSFHRQVLRPPAFIVGDADTSFIQRHKAALAPASPDEDTAALAAALDAAPAEARDCAGGVASDPDLSNIEIPRRRRDK